MFHDRAKDRLPEDVYAFISSGSFDELAIKRNREALDAIALLPRVLTGLKSVSTSTTVFDHNIDLPVIIAPAAYQCLLSENGELDMLSATEASNTIMILSMFSSTDYALVTKHKKSPVWMQMYLLKDRAINEAFLAEAEMLNYDAIVLTVDAPVYAKKDKERATPLKLPEHIKFDHLKKIGIPIDECRQGKRHLSTLLDPSISWSDVEWIASKTKLPIILKGIIDPRDSQIAIQHPSVQGLIISNHGGRQLDSCVSAIEVLQAHKQIVGDRLPVFMDGSITRGSDVFKALALGSDAVLMGRTALWALTTAGSSGVQKALEIIKSELSEVMTLCGCSSISDISSEYIIK